MPLRRRAVNRAPRRVRLALGIALACWVLPGQATPTHAAGLEVDLGRNDVRVLGATLEIRPGDRIGSLALAERLERRGYRRVRRRPTTAGEFFWGHELFWIHRMPRDGGTLVGLVLRPSDGSVVRLRDAADGDAPGRLRFAPLLLAESLDPGRAARIPVVFDALPEHVWRCVLAAEDHRFYDHVGIDGRALARALLRNAREGRVVQGGSTITQQLVKLRDMTPTRSVGRKLSEAARSLALEASYDKREILETYLDSVYFGHVDGVSIYGLGAAASAYFSTASESLDLGQAAMLAAMIQGPNRLAPQRHPGRVLERQRWVLSRMRELGWADDGAVEAASRALPRLRLDPPTPAISPHLLGWVDDVVRLETPRRHRGGRGVVVQTSIDPLVQDRAERAVADGLRRLRRDHERLRSMPLSAALVAIDARDGAVLAHVGGDPRALDDRFDRARRARRQPGSVLKPFVALEALDGCGARRSLFPARRVRDEPLSIDLPSGPWRPENYDRRWRGTVTLRETLVDSLNVPTVRVARWCGFEPTASRWRRAGIPLGDQPPPSFVLGAVETTPLEVARAYTAFGVDGRLVEPRPVTRIDAPSGRRLSRPRRESRRVAGVGAAWLVRDMLREVVARGTGRSARVDGAEAWGKTGTARDAWFAGGVGHVVAVVWVGSDDGRSIELTGSSAAAPIWREFMSAAALRCGAPPTRPPSVVDRWLQTSSGLLVGSPRRDATRELFVRGQLPPRRRLLAADQPVPPVE